MEAGPRSVAGEGWRLSRFELGCLAIVLLAFLYRLTFLVLPDVIWDSAWYLALARAFADEGAFLVTWFDPPAPSGYWPPLFPAFASLFVRVLGPDPRAVVAAAITASLLLTLAVFLMTRDLHGRTRAFAAAAFVAASPIFLFSDGRGMSESLLALTVALAVYGFVKGLRRPAWLLLAGAGAVLAYLAKATLGLPLLAAAVAVVAAWRLRALGWRGVLRSPPDLAMGALALVGLALVALLSPGTLGGVGLGLLAPIGQALREPAFLPVFLFKLVFAAGFLAFVALPFSLRLPQAWQARRGEAEGALWLAALLPLAAGAVFSAGFQLAESRSLVDFDNIRYLSPSLVPLLWLLLPHWPANDRARPDEPAAGEPLRRRHEALFAAAVGLLALLLLLNPLIGTPTPGRFVALLALALVPLGLAWAARSAQVAPTTRRLASGQPEHRYAPARPPPLQGSLAALILVLSGLLGFYVSVWFIGVALALAVALCARSPRAQVVAMALLLLAGAVPTYHTPTPWKEAVAAAAQAAGPGGVVGVVGEPVYVAGVAPEGTTLRIAHADNASVDALLVMHHLSDVPPGAPSVGPYVLARSWNATFAPSPGLAARLWIETNLLGESYSFEGPPTASLYVRAPQTT